MASHTETPKVALLYHLNLNHFSLSGENRNRYAEQYLSDMVGHIQVPTTISIPAEDLLYLYLHYQETYVDLVSNPHISFLLSTFAHMIASHDFSSYQDQAVLGGEIIQMLIPSERLVPVGYPSEVDVPKSEDLGLLRDLRKGIVLGESRVLPVQKRDHFIWKYSENGFFPTFLSRRSVMYRDFCHRYYRSEASPEEIVQALTIDANNFSQSIGFLARIDMETPILNEVAYPNGYSSGPRIDLWKQLQNTYSKQPNVFISFFDLVKRRKHSHLNSTAIEHNPSEDGKWKFDTHTAAIDSLGKLVSKNSFFWYAWLSAHHSDYFCTEQTNIRFKASQGGIIEISKRQMYREPELRAKLDLVQGQPYNGDVQLVGEYIDRMTRLYSKLESGLRDKS